MEIKNPCSEIEADQCVSVYFKDDLQFKIYMSLSEYLVLKGEQDLKQKHHQHFNTSFLICESQLEIAELALRYE